MKSKEMFEGGDICRRFLAWTPGFCSEELLLPESIGQEKVQTFSQMRINQRFGLIGSKTMTGIFY